MSVQTPPAADVSAERERASFGKLFLPEYFWTTVSALAGLTIVALGNYVLTTAMPRVLTDLGDPVLYAWATSAYMLSPVAGLSLGGAWRDRAGLRAPFLASVTAFGLGSLACALAPSMAWLVAARTVQGLGGGGIGAIAYAAGATYPEGLRLRMYALNSGLSSSYRCAT